MDCIYYGSFYGQYLLIGLRPLTVHVGKHVGVLDTGRDYKFLTRIPVVSGKNMIEYQQKCLVG